MGNGHFLMRLREKEEDDEGEEGDRQSWAGRMLGVDYSERSVEFAKRIAGDRDLNVEFRWWDIMNQSPSSASILDGDQKEGWDVVLDKGTFDAISLSEEMDERGRRVCEGYKERVLPLVREGGVFLVTSCNWTEEELVGWFGGETGGFVECGRIGYKSYSFGGVKGQTISSVCFRRQKSER